MHLDDFTSITQISSSEPETSLNKTDQIVQSLLAAKQREEAGDYEAARSALTGLWHRIGERPRLEGLDASTQAELLLRVGALSGWLGSANQIEGAQEFAKD